MVGPRGNMTSLEGGGSLDPNITHDSPIGFGRIRPAGVDPEFDGLQYEDPEISIVEESGF